MNSGIVLIWRTFCEVLRNTVVYILFKSLFLAVSSLNLPASTGGQASHLCPVSCVDVQCCLVEAREWVRPSFLYPLHCSGQGPQCSSGADSLGFLYGMLALLSLLYFPKLVRMPDRILCFLPHPLCVRKSLPNSKKKTRVYTSSSLMGVEKL